ncbi:MAG: YaaR family protein [Candidatus Goldbacteria bacterium]|nr:YaaR family protein [Candidatus Goldiibacteriota bacterium]
MRIPETSGQFGDNKAQIGKTKRSTGKNRATHVSRDMVNQPNFMKNLDEVTEEEIRKTFDELIKDIDDQAKILERHRTFEELEKYKDLIKSFIDQVVKKIYMVKVSDSSKIMIKRKKIYYLVEQVDAHLEELTKQVLNKQSETLQFLATIEKIKGLLVDMYS